MPLPNPEPGLVIFYAYLWSAEYERGREEGMKDRPCAIVLAAQDEEGDTIVTVVPITHTRPGGPNRLKFLRRPNIGLVLIPSGPG